MSIIKRKSGGRRSDKSVEFPLTDLHGGHVTINRRHVRDRRKSTASFEELLILFSQLPSEDPNIKH
jgi:hypothetical protein